MARSARASSVNKGQNKYGNSVAAKAAAPGQAKKTTANKRGAKKGKASFARTTGNKNRTKMGAAKASKTEGRGRRKAY
jgi:hypothetical protein